MSRTEPRDLQAAAHRKLQGPGHRADVFHGSTKTDPVENYRHFTARLHDAQNALFQNTKESAEKSQREFRALK
jgi:hypothetical protein